MLKKLMNVALSGKQIVNAVKTNLISYSELKHITNIEQILGPYKACVILYESKDRYGHWCVLFEQKPDTIEFMDSYGYFIDSELKYISKNFLKKKGLFHTYLINLLYSSHYKYIEYNNYPMQELKEGINTCGRHVITRLLYRNLKLDDYYQMIKNSGYTADEFVTLKTKNIS
jgi:hypothetical protein